MKAITSLLFIFILSFSAPAYPVRIDGKIWDWETVPELGKCKIHVLSKDRAGLDIEGVKIVLGSKYLYMLIQGKSVTGQKPDLGEGFKKTSIRVSFSSAQSPLNRVRFLAHPYSPWKMRMATPYAPAKIFGSKEDKYWVFGRFRGDCYVELKFPTVRTQNGVHIGGPSGPLVSLSDTKSPRKHISDILINAVDVKTKRLVDTVTLPVYRTSLL